MATLPLPSSPEKAVFVDMMKSVMTLSGDTAPDSDEFTELWWVSFSNGNWDVTSLNEIESQLPAKYEKHPTVPNFYRTKLTFSKHNDIPNVADIHVTYSSKVKDLGQKLTEDTNTWITNPLKRQAIITYDTVQQSKNFDRVEKVQKPEVKDGKLVVPDEPYDTESWRPQTTAGEFVSIEDQYNDMIISVEKNVIGAPDIFSDETRFLNRDTVTINKIKYKPTTLLLEEFKLSERKIENGFVFYTLNYRLHHNPKGWYKRVDNVGTVGRLPTVSQITNADGKTEYYLLFPGQGFDRTVYPVKPLLWGQPPERISVPIPLDKFGTVISNWITLDQKTGKISLNLSPELTDKELTQILDENAMYCYTARLIKFSDYLPLK